MRVGEWREGFERGNSGRRGVGGVVVVGGESGMKAGAAHESGMKAGAAHESSR